MQSDDGFLLVGDNYVIVTDHQISTAGCFFLFFFWTSLFHSIGPLEAFYLKKIAPAQINWFGQMGWEYVILDLCVIDI
jgi:hypothetical protein